MHGIIFDTETTGFPENSLPYSDPKQPIIVQLAVQHCEVQENKLIKGPHWVSYANNPYGVAFNSKASEITGITAETIKDAPHIYDVMSKFLSEVAEADFVIAHNAKFDRLLSIITCGHINRVRDKGQLTYDALLEANVLCSMLSAMPILKLPGKFGQYKWPNLGECYRFFYKKDFEGAHDAMIDVNATFDVVNAMGFDKLVSWKG